MKLHFAGHCNNKVEPEIVCKQRLLAYYLLNQGVTDVNLHFAGDWNTSYEKVLELFNFKKIIESYFYIDYVYKEKKDEHIQKSIKLVSQNIFLDSGAYSAFSRGVKIDIQEYISFIKKYKNKINIYANLDVIGDEKATKKNQQIMEKAGLHPIPVFHYGESWGYLKYLVDNYYYIAVGGLVPISKNQPKIINHLNKCFSIIKDDCKVHGFGVTNTTLLKMFPFYSTDSTSWLGGSMRAEVYQFTGEDMITISMKSKQEMKPELSHLIDNEEKRWLFRVIYNAIEWQKFEQFVTELWKEKGVAWDE